MGSHSKSPLVLPGIRQLESTASASAGVRRTTISAVTSIPSHPVPTDAHHGTSGGDREISLLTPPKELLAVVAELQMELRARTDSVNAIQRNFQRLNALYQKDRAEHARTAEELLARANASREAEGAHNVNAAAMRAQIESLLEEYRSLEESTTLALLARQESLEAAELQVIEAKRAQVQLEGERGVLEAALSTRTAALHKLEEALADAQRDAAAGVRLQSQTTENWYHTIVQLVEAVAAALGDDVTQRSAEGQAAPLEVPAVVPDNPMDWINSELLPKLLRKIQMQTQRLAALRRTALEQDGYRAVWLTEAESHGRRVLKVAEAMARQWASLALQGLTLASREMAGAQEMASKCDDMWTRLHGELDMMSQSQAALASSHWEELLASVEAQLAENFRVASQRAAAGEAALQVEMASLHTQMDAERRRHAQGDRALAARLQQSERDCANYRNRLQELEAAQQAHVAATALARSQLESSFCEEQSRVSAELSRAKLQLLAAEREAAQLRSQHNAAQTHWCALQHCVSLQVDARLTILTDESSEWGAIQRGATQHYVQVMQGEAATVAVQRRALADTMAEESAQRAAVVTAYALQLQHEAYQHWPHTLAVKLTQRAAAAEQEAAAAQASQERCVLLEAARVASLQDDLSRLQDQLHGMDANNKMLESELRLTKEALRASASHTVDHQRLVQQSIQRIVAAEEASESTYSCLLCLELFTKPRTCVPCGHTFCEACFLNHPKNRKIAAGMNATQWIGASPTAKLAAPSVEAGTPFYCPECRLHNATGVVETRSLSDLRAKFGYKRQALQDILNTLRGAAANVSRSSQ